MKSRELIDRPQKRLGFLRVATDAPACDSDPNNTAWADALGLAPRPPVYRRDRDLSALSQTAEMEDDGLSVEPMKPEAEQPCAQA